MRTAEQSEINRAMTPQQLRTLVTHALGPDLLDLGPAEALRRAEEAADADPAARDLAEAVSALRDRVLAPSGLPNPVAGVQRDRLVRWDRWTSTWIGTELATGEVAQVRALRKDAVGDPVLRRTLLRDGRALATVMPNVRGHDGPWPCLTAVRDTDRDPVLRVRDHAARLLATGVEALGVWDDAGLAPPPLTDDELSIHSGRLQIVCLTAEPTGGMADHIASLARFVARNSPGGGTAVHELLEGMQAMTPASIADACALVTRALSRELAQLRHELLRRWVQTEHGSRRHRLHRAVEGLAAAVPPPEGRGAVGVDLDGRVTVVEGRSSRVRWGPADELDTVFEPSVGFHAPSARRLLRARANAPSNAHLQARVGGDAAYTDRIGRWVAAGLRLRTVRLLLERDGGT